MVETRVNAPVKSGDNCTVIAGALGTTGPNVGKVVTVRNLRGEHSQHGRIWRCTGAGLVTEYGALADEADFAASWLKKIEPPPAPLKRAEIHKETT